MHRQICFVLMPFSVKKDVNGRKFDFDSIYNDLIAPAIDEVGLECIRADEEELGGIIHKPMFERLILCEFAVADLSTANANVFYELGIRHATRPFTTILLYAKDTRIPFDVSPVRAVPYEVNSRGKVKEVDKAKEFLKEKLLAAIELARKSPAADSPIFQLLDGMQPVALDHDKTEIFRARVQYSKKRKDELAAARRQGIDQIKFVEKDLGDLGRAEYGVLIDLLISYREVSAWDEMIDLVNKMPQPLSSTVLVQEQLGLALNRAKRSDEAEGVLLDLLLRRGPTPETLGILGRVYKDRWAEAVGAGDKHSAAAWLDKTIETYTRGFQADFRDTYPGINIVTFLEIKGGEDEEKDKIARVVEYAINHRIERDFLDYWDFAVQLELAVIMRNEEVAVKALQKALTEIKGKWQPETTAKNLSHIRMARAQRGEAIAWATEIESVLITKSK